MSFYKTTLCFISSQSLRINIKNPSNGEETIKCFIACVRQRISCIRSYDKPKFRKKYYKILLDYRKAQ